MLTFLMAIEDEEIRGKLEYLYLKHRKTMIYQALQITKDFHASEDVVQTAFIKLADYIEKIDDLNCNKTRGLIAIIVRHTAIDYNRKRQHKEALIFDGLEEVLEDRSASFEIRLVELDAIERTMARLAEENSMYADILTLKYFYHYENDIIIDLLNISSENLRVRLHRARKRFKELILEEGAAVSEG